MGLNLKYKIPYKLYFKVGTSYINWYPKVHVYSSFMFPIRILVMVSFISFAQKVLHTLQ
jgi:hypothetical protein